MVDWRFLLRFLAVGLAILSLSAAFRPALAQTPSPLAEWQYSAGVALMPMMMDSIPEWQIEVGPAVAVQPLYPGSNQYTVVPGAVLDIRYEDLAFLSTGEGLGINLLRGKGYRAGAALGFDVGRPQGESHLLRGLGNIPAAPTPKLFAEYVIFPVVFRVDIRRAIGGYDGFAGELSAYMPVIGNEEFFVFAGPSLSFADANYMRRYFGVTRSQSIASGYPTFRSGGGAKELSLGVSANWIFAPDWLLDADWAIKRLFDRASHSPLTNQTTQYTMSLAVSYQY